MQAVMFTKISTKFCLFKKSFLYFLHPFQKGKREITCYEFMSPFPIDFQKISDCSHVKECICLGKGNM